MNLNTKKRMTLNTEKYLLTDFDLAIDEINIIIFKLKIDCIYNKEIISKLEEIRKNLLNLNIEEMDNYNSNRQTYICLVSDYI